MNSIEDRLSRVAALRPRMPVRDLRSVSEAGSDRLIRLLEGENRVNRFGSHVRVQRRLPNPLADEISPRAMRLISRVPADSVCDHSRWLFLDTETTGLAGGTGTYAFLVGLGWWEKGVFCVEQLFMRDHGEERSLLLGLQERLAPGWVLVTFNGKSYDWPLLQTRFKMSRIGTVSEPLAHLDLLHPARRLWRLRLKSVALTQLEQNVLRLDRGPDIPSESIPQRYFDFLRGGAPEPIMEIFQHNQMDLCGLASLVLHMNSILADPEKCECGASELFGISRMLQRDGDERLAQKTYQRAIERGLPLDAERLAQRELALMAKRGRDFDLSNALWLKLLDDSSEGVRACEQLAIYYEHRASVPETAASFCREALVRLRESFNAGRMSFAEYQRRHSNFQHRLARLVKKI